MLEEKKERLNALIRGNEGKRILKHFLPKLVETLNQPALNIKFISLEETDSLRFSFYKAFKQAEKNPKNAYIGSDLNKLYDCIKKVGLNKNQNKGYVFFRDSDKFGALELNFTDFLKHALELLHLDGDTVYFLFKDSTKGFYLTYSKNKDKSIYEVISIS